MHKYKDKRAAAFTVSSPGLVNELVSPIWVSEFIAAQELTGERIKEISKSHKYQCVWDTGATSTCITRKIVKELGLTPIGRTQFLGVGAAGQEKTVHEAYTYLINVYFPQKVILGGIEVADADLGGCDVLLGMDIIRLGDLAISNFNEQTTFSFRTPSLEKTDYVEEINTFIKKNQKNQVSSKTKRPARSKRRPQTKKKKRR